MHAMHMDDRLSATGMHWVRKQGPVAAAAAMRCSWQIQTPLDGPCACASGACNCMSSISAQMKSCNVELLLAEKRNHAQRPGNLLVSLGLPFVMDLL